MRLRPGRRLGRLREDDPAPAAGTVTAEHLPAELFDADYYLTTYPDVAATGLTPDTHFHTVGRLEGRSPSAGWTLVEPAIRLRAESSRTPAADIVALFPPEGRHELATAAPWLLLRRMTHPDFYAAQHKAAAGWSPDRVVDHYLSGGALEDLRPSALFHPAWYERGLQLKGLPAVAPGEVPLLHWITFGSRLRVVPTPLFDEDYYRARHQDLSRWDAWLFDHYLTYGVYEPHRLPSAVMTARPSAQVPAADHRPVFLEHLLGSATTIDVRCSSAFEEGAAQVRSTLERLASPAMRSVVQRAAGIEPLLGLPQGPWAVSHPPYSPSFLDLAHVAERVRRALPAPHADTVVLVPQLRTGVYRRAITALLHSWSVTEPGDRPLVLTTDVPSDGPPEVAASVLDLADFARHLSAGERQRLLLDVLRGLTPLRVVNVDSRLGWDTWHSYGRQLSAWTRLVAHPVSWDLVPAATPSGSYLSELQGFFALLSGVVLGADLQAELIGRSTPSRSLRERLQVGSPPVEPSRRLVGPDAAERTGPFRPLCVRWVGRRLDDPGFDVVIGLATRMPELRVRAWTTDLIAPELSSPRHLPHLPANLELCGDYRGPEESSSTYDVLIVTPAASAVPPALLDAGMHNCPVVAERAGAVADLVDETTGYPVPPGADAPAYAAAVRELRSDRPGAERRARALRARVEPWCSAARYDRAVAAAFGTR